jgi:hypothetical protein
MVKLTHSPDFIDSVRMPSKRANYGKNVDKDRCAECGGVVVLVDGPVLRWNKWWNAGEWIHRERCKIEHDASPMRELAL